MPVKMEDDKNRYVIHKKKSGTINAVIERNAKINTRHMMPPKQVPVPVHCQRLAHWIGDQKMFRSDLMQQR